MTGLIQRQPMVAVLAVAAAVLVGAIGIETGFGTRLGPSIPSGVSKRAVPYEAKVLPPLAASDAERAYPEMVARPLFTPTRRPVPPAEAESQATFKRGQYVLQGVIIAGDTRIAMLREKSTGKMHRVEKGHELNGMKLSEVNPESVTLALGKDHEVLALQVLKQGPASAAPPEGPFGPPGPATAPAFPGAAAHPGGANPLSAPTGAGQPTAPESGAAKAPSFGPPPNAAPGTVPQATTAPLTPEELLARRRARRAPQTQ